MATPDTESSAAHYSDSLKPLLDQLPKISYGDTFTLYQWEGFWYAPRHLEAAKSVQSNFEARDDDIILASSLKTGTIWLKALLFCIMGPKISDINEDPLLKNHPAVYVQTLETQTYLANPNPDLSSMPTPRLFHTHMPYNVLPDSIKNSKCKMVYIVRNPKDTLVSMWHFFSTVKQYPIQVLFEGFCNGVHPFGPFFDHVLQFWNESLRAPEKVLFLKYEELKSDPKGQVKKLAAFLGRPFENEEQVDQVLWRSSLERLKNLEVNKTGFDPWAQMPNSSFFRRGVVGDWKNALTPEMEERLDQITKTKLAGSGLDLVFVVPC
ncbi:cytosolic sulfotransferase 5-like [Coffea eugenioides]|uniref:cytosolic sulfotransferase 5-like n=1 Tax=Coffea eugenioides TaxID=49369 RepID=UPI000F5D332C|nr:cytosolic sulfotransferase 5-like [Coffea arabica]XP_027155514.1 cytosolic sulfotransferase 5-like [Coffea eugenioides]XP_027158411.1 cytosolic sulfotransferase 5-like [Coffea eugenioides]